MGAWAPMDRDDYTIQYIIITQIKLHQKKCGDTFKDVLDVSWTRTLNGLSVSAIQEGGNLPPVRTNKN